jgi:nicotinamide-nucleotide amidase
MNKSIYALAAQVGEALAQQGASLTLAESCTGGGVAHAITAVPGSSGWFGAGFVTYANSAKQKLLGVSADTLAEEGAVSESVVVAMAQGALEAAGADYAVALSGIAGPGGGSADKPVGTVWFCWAGPEAIVSRNYLLSGTRDQVREQAITISLKELLHQITGSTTV